MKCTQSRHVVLGALAALTLLVSGCASQINALAPVSGDTVFIVRTAAVDVLIDEGLSIKQVPICTTDDTGIVCTGTLVDGSDITVTAEGKKPTTMTITVSGDVVFDGSIQQVIDDAARGES